MTFTARGLYASSSKEPRGRRGRWWLVIGAIVGLAALGTGVLGILTTAVSETTTDTTEFPAPSRLEIDNNTEGSVTLVAEDTDTVTVRVDVWSSMMSQPSWDTETEGDTLRLAANCSLIFTVFGRCSVDYEVAVPEGTEVSVHTVTGDVDVTGVSARVDASTDTGEIRLADVTGEITAESATGRITAAGSGPSAVVTSDTDQRDRCDPHRFGLRHCPGAQRHRRDHGHHGHRVPDLACHHGDREHRTAGARPGLPGDRGHHCRIPQGRRGPVQGRHLRHRSTQRHRGHHDHPPLSLRPRPCTARAGLPRAHPSRFAGTAPEPSRPHQNG